MSLKKSQAYGWGLICIMVVFGVCVLNKKLDITAAVLTAIVTLTTTYMGVQAADNGIKGKFFNSGLEGK